MLSKSIMENVEMIMHLVPFVTREQLEFFFNIQENGSRPEDVIRQMDRTGYFSHQTLFGYEVLRGKNTIHFSSKRAVEDFLDSMWVIAAFGEESISTFHVVYEGGPTYFLITDENQPYDIMPCRTEMDAWIGYNARHFHGDDDMTSHIALCYSQESAVKMMEKLILYEFDSYCVLDTETNDVTYGKVRRK